MKVNIVPIGTSKGIRIPKTVLTQCHIESCVDMEIRGDTILLKPYSDNPREGWEEACKKMHKDKDDQLFIEDHVDLNEEDWQW